jgi:type IV secretory pathway TrbF-like protein
MWELEVGILIVVIIILIMMVYQSNKSGYIPYMPRRSTQVGNARMSPNGSY